MASFRQSLVALLLYPWVCQAQSFNVTFAPWVVMGPVRSGVTCLQSGVLSVGTFALKYFFVQVNTSGTGYALLDFANNTASYKFHLFNVSGLKNIELHVGEPGTHGDVVAVFYAAAFADPTNSTQGLVAQGFIDEYDLVGPMLLPLGQHLSIEELYERYACAQVLNTVPL